MKASAKTKHGFLLRRVNCFCGNPQPSFRTFPGYIVRAYLSAPHFWRMREYGVSFRRLGAEQCQKSGRSAMSRRQQNYVIIVIVESFDNVEISLIFHRIFCGERTRDSHISLAFIIIKRNCKCKILVWNNSWYNKYSLLCVCCWPIKYL